MFAKTLTAPLRNTVAGRPSWAKPGQDFPTDLGSCSHDDGTPRHVEYLGKQTQKGAEDAVEQPDPLGGLAAMVGGAIEILLAPFINSAYSMTEVGADLVPPWEPALSNALRPLFTFAPPYAVYETYGKLHVLVFLGLLFGLLGLGAWRGERAGRLERWGYRLSFAGLVLNLPGNLLDYWIPGNNDAGSLGFVLGTVPGLLLLAAGSIALGVALLRAGEARHPGWLLVLSLPGAVVLGLLGFSNAPANPMLWLAVAWLLLGRFLWTRDVVHARQPMLVN